MFYFLVLLSYVLFFLCRRGLEKVWVGFLTSLTGDLLFFEFPAFPYFSISYTLDRSSIHLILFRFAFEASEN